MVAATISQFLKDVQEIGSFEIGLNYKDSDRFQALSLGLRLAKGKEGRSSITYIN